MQASAGSECCEVLWCVTSLDVDAEELVKTVVLQGRGEHAWLRAHPILPGMGTEPMKRM